MLCRFDAALPLASSIAFGITGQSTGMRLWPYESGRARHPEKSGYSSRRELVIAGFFLSAVSPSAIATPVLGAYEGGRLKHVGRVDTGFSHAMARDLYRSFVPGPA